MDPADHHTPMTTREVPSSTGTGASSAGLSSTPSHHETHSSSAVPTSSTEGHSTGHSATPAATTGDSSHAGHSAGHHAVPGADGTGNHNQSEAAAGLGSDPWEGKELPSQQAQHADIAAHEGAGAGGDQELGEDGYPVQRHAGSVGLGPNYKKHPNTADKIGGTIEEIKGKILKKPEVVEHGHDRKTGELEHKKELQEEKEDPFKKEADATDSKPKDTPHPAKSAVSHDDTSKHSQGMTATSQHTTESGGAPGAIGTNDTVTPRAL